jgi:hypothetical protein
MSGSYSGPTLQTPTQAALTFSQQGGFPRQRNVFIVRFVPGSYLASVFTGNLTFAVKSVDRPHVNPKLEELNQYNKKRQIHTGFKIEPLKLQFYDSADGCAQNMWTIYSRYYFGDFNNSSSPSGSNRSYSYDATYANFKDFAGTGFGFTANNGGSEYSDAMFFFNRLEIFHFYDGYFDQYNLGNPRISGWEADDLDYSNSEISTINTTIAYENIQYFPQQLVSTAIFPEFSYAFNGNPVNVPGGYVPISPFATIPSLLPANPSVQSLLASYSSGAYAANYSGSYGFRFGGSLSLGALGTFGSFSFGPLTIGGYAGASLNLSNMSLGNPALSASLNIGVSAGIGGGIGVYGGIGVGLGVSGATFQATAAVTAGAMGAFSNSVGVTKAALAGIAIGGGGAFSTSAGISLSPAAMGVFNSQQTGTSQIGFNAGSVDNGTWDPAPAAGPSSGFSAQQQSQASNPPTPAADDSWC